MTSFEFSLDQNYRRKADFGLGEINRYQYHTLDDLALIQLASESGLLGFGDRQLRGLGDGAGVPVLQPTLNTAIASGASIGTAAALGSSLAIPIIGAAVAGVTLAIGLWINRLGPKQKIATTKIVNEAEPYLKQNLDAWNSSKKTVSDQKQALVNFDNIWLQVEQTCSQSQYGEPGYRCIQDRMPQGMTVTINGNSYTGNGKWNWFSYYRDPIANDPNVMPDPTVTETLAGGLKSAFDSFGNPVTVDSQGNVVSQNSGDTIFGLSYGQLGIGLVGVGLVFALLNKS